MKLIESGDALLYNKGVNCQYNFKEALINSAFPELTGRTQCLIFKN